MERRDISGYSLAEMVEASAIMAEYKELGDTPNSTKSFMRCDDRALAAMYVITHYRPEIPDDDGNAESILDGDGCGLFLIRIQNADERDDS